MITAWNEVATPESALKGAKYTGVLLLLGAPPTVLEVILKHNGKVGRDKTFFTDGTWTCKKLYPGGVWKGPTKFWNMKTTEESFLAMVSKLALAQEAKPPGMRSSVQLTAIQDVAHQCAFMVKVIGDVAGRLSVPRVEVDGPSKYGWLHYIKGAARSATLLVIVKLMLKIMGTGAACRFLNAELWETYCHVYVRWDVWRPDKRTISFRNAQLSHAGSIREPNDMITWVIKLKALHDSGTPAH